MATRTLKRPKHGDGRVDKVVRFTDLLESQYSHVLFRFVDPLELLSTCSRVSKSFARAAARDAVWKPLCHDTFGLSPDGSGGAPILPPTSIPAGGVWDAKSTTSGVSYKNVWIRWSQVYMSIGLRPDATPGQPIVSCPVASTWSLFNGWLRRNMRPAAESLRPNRDAPRLLARLEGVIGTKLPRQIREIYRVFDGQNLARDDAAFDVEGDRGLVNAYPNQTWLGIFGGYSAYRHRVSVRMLPLRHAIRLTEYLQRSFPERSLQRSAFLFAASHSLRKLIFYDAKTHDVVVGVGPNRQSCVPDAVRGRPDALLRWLREFVRRLLEGVYEVSPIVPEEGKSTNGINLFPVQGPLKTVAVTHGVRIASSSVYMPEHPQGWTYSIRMRLARPGEEGYIPASDRGFESCQLVTRHWVVREDGQSEQDARHVRGRGVIGMYPILTENGWILSPESDPHGQHAAESGEIKGEFVYQSCSGRFREGKGGSFGGDMQFIPGTASRPVGPEFDVDVDEFPLKLPDFKY